MRLKGENIRPATACQTFAANKPPEGWFGARGAISQKYDARARAIHRSGFGILANSRALPALCREPVWGGRLGKQAPAARKGPWVEPQNRSRPRRVHANGLRRVAARTNAASEALFAGAALANDRPVGRWLLNPRDFQPPNPIDSRPHFANGRGRAAPSCRGRRCAILRPR